MKKIQPSERIGKEMEDILHPGTTDHEDLLSPLVKLSKPDLQEFCTMPAGFYPVIRYMN